MKRFEEISAYALTQLYKKGKLVSQEKLSKVFEIDENNEIKLYTNEIDYSKYNTSVKLRGYLEEKTLAEALSKTNKLLLLVDLGIISRVLMCEGYPVGILREKRNTKLNDVYEFIPEEYKPHIHKEIELTKASLEEKGLILDNLREEDIYLIGGKVLFENLDDSHYSVKEEKVKRLVI